MTLPGPTPLCQASQPGRDGGHSPGNPAAIPGGLWARTSTAHTGTRQDQGHRERQGWGDTGRSGGRQRETGRQTQREESGTRTGQRERPQGREGGTGTPVQALPQLHTHPTLTPHSPQLTPHSLHTHPHTHPNSAPHSPPHSPTHSHHTHHTHTHSPHTHTHYPEMFSFYILERM